jgi:hypothetical protein
MNILDWLLGKRNICPICARKFKVKRMVWSGRLVDKDKPRTSARCCYSPACNYAAGALNVGRTGEAHQLQEWYAPGDIMGKIIGEAALAKWHAWADIMKEHEAQWEPIKTAPKDGTLVDLWVDGARLPDCRWGSQYDDPEDYNGWYQRYAENSASDFLVTGTPTAWMARPEKLWDTTTTSTCKQVDG